MMAKFGCEVSVSILSPEAKCGDLCVCRRHRHEQINDFQIAGSAPRTPPGPPVNRINKGCRANNKAGTAKNDANLLMLRKDYATVYS